MTFISNHYVTSMFSALRTPILILVIASSLVLSTGDAGGQSVIDDHGDSYDTATLIELGTSLEGSIDPGDDRDVFKIDLSDATGETDLWVYNLDPDQDVPFDTFGGLYDSAGNLIELNDDGWLRDSFRQFSIRSVVPPGVYYVIVVGFTGDPGDYTLYAQAVDNPGNTIETAKPLDLGSQNGGTINTVDDADYFKLDFTETKNVIIDAVTADISAIEAALLDADGNEISSNFTPRLIRGFRGSRVGIFWFGFAIEEDFEPGTYYLKVTNPFAPDPDEPEPEPEEPPPPFRPAPYALLFLEDTEYTELLDDCEAQTDALNDPQISDPLYACQWHLSSPDRQDINLGTVWADGLKGEGINVAVVDDGIYHAHEDLQENVDVELSFDYGGNEDIYDPTEHHGTNVSGIVAGRDNDKGVRGVAPRATVYGYNFLGGRNATIANLLDAMIRNAEETAVSNNSWGWRDGPGLSPSLSFWRQAIRYGTTFGYDGKGVFYVFAAGNGHLLGDDSNLSEYANDYGLTAACSVNKDGTRAGYSEMGANLWICAPSNDRPGSLGGVNGILTTENSDRYYHDFGGTSAATPIVSGVAALARDANPELTWRDIKIILAASAQKNDPTSPGWDDGAPMHPVSSTDMYSFNHEYGFGVVNAEGAVDLAKRWTNLPASKNTTVFSDVLDVTIPDAPAGGEPSTFTHTLTLDTEIEFTEFVEVTLVFEHDSFRDLEILLESPSGAKSRLAVPYDTYNAVRVRFGGSYEPLDGSFQFGSAKHLGEDPNGEWKLHVTDRIPVVDGTFIGFGITVYGHERAPGVPTLDSVVDHRGGGMLDVAWSAPDEADDSDVTAYDLRYIASEADETEPASWTVLEGVWTADSGEGLAYTIDELTDGTLYDVQVRAMNSVGAGLWSESLTGTPMTSHCVTSGAIEERDRMNSGRIRDCEALLEARDTLAGTATLDWSEDVSLGEWEGVGVDKETRRVARLFLQRKGLNGTIPSALGDLSSLEWLYLHANDLTGEIPPELADLSNLTRLYLNHNQLSGTIPSRLGEMTSLQKLLIHRNALTGTIPGELAGMTELQWLSTYSNELTGTIPGELGGLPNLRRLYLHNNSLSGSIPAEDLADSTTLTHLYLDRNPLNGEIPASLGLITSLTHLRLQETGLTGNIPAELGDLTNLVWLALYDNRLDGEIPSELGDLANLQRLYLHSNQLSGAIPSELGNLSTLTNLWLKENRLSGDIPAELGNLANLNRVRISQNPGLTGCIPAGLAAVVDSDHAALGLPNCP